MSLQQKSSIGELRLNPISKKHSKTHLGDIGTRKTTGKTPSGLTPTVNDKNFHQMLSPSTSKKSSFDNLSISDNTTFHAPDNLLPVRRYAKSRNELNLEENGLLEMKLNALSPEPLKPIASFKSKTEFENSDYKYRSSFKDGFL